MAAGKQIVLVTGVNSGTGLETAYYPTKTANNHVIMGVRNLEKSQSRKPQSTLGLLALHVSVDESIHAAAKNLEATLGRLDVLVNNAGNQIQPRLLAHGQLREAFEINIYGTVILTQTLIPLILASQGKNIINLPPSTRSARQLTTHLKDQGGKVWSFCPGFVVTNLVGQRKYRVAMGAQSSETSVQAVLDIVEGKKNVEAGTFIGRYDVRIPW
ncbi:short chain dehydrogenase [Paraphaeosphaeria sporulosa]